jgi:hypothetical protein
MKSFKKLLVLPLTMVALLVAATAAKADPTPLSIVLDAPFQSGLTGQTVDFTGTIWNLTGSPVDMPGDSFTLAGGLTGSDAGFLANTPFTLDALTSTGDVDLFAITIAPGTAAGIYAGVFDIMDGSTVVGEVDFDIQVTPEPGTILLLGTGLLLLAGMIRWRMPKTTRLTIA